MDRKPFVAGNWKMNLNKAEAVALAKGVAEKAKGNTAVTVGVAPAFVHLDAVGQAIGGSGVLLWAQDFYFEKNGAFTGEISTAMLKDLKVDFVLVGHSERRHVIKESDVLLNAKVKAGLAAGLMVVLCVGETIDERKANRTMEVVKQQLESGVAGTKEFGISPKNFVIAYEPVWAIGTGLTATPEQAEEVHAFIRGQLKTLFGDSFAADTVIQYGGSVKPSNAKELMGKADIDGALVGGASLKVDDFVGIIEGAK